MTQQSVSQAEKEAGRQANGQTLRMECEQQEL